MPRKKIAKTMRQFSMKLIMTQRETRETVVESSDGVIKPPKSISSVELSFLCHKHVSHTLGHIYLDGECKIVPRIWGDVGSKTLFH